MIVGTIDGAKSGVSEGADPFGMFLAAAEEFVSGPLSATFGEDDGFAEVEDIGEVEMSGEERGLELGRLVRHGQTGRRADKAIFVAKEDD